MLRHFSTPPNRSETVEGFARPARTLESEQPTTARSPHIPLKGHIEHPATLQKYRAYTRVRLTTQEPGHAPSFKYRVVLRTIDSRFGSEGWRKHSDYVDWVWRTDYEPVSGDPKCKRLRTEFSASRVLSPDIVLHEGITPAQPVHKKSQQPLQIRAHTFDWYVPLLPIAWAPEAVDIARVGVAVGAAGGGQPGGTGGMSIHLMSHASMREASGTVPMKTLGGSPPVLVSLFDDFATQDLQLALAEDSSS